MCGIVVVIGKNSKVKAREAIAKLDHRGSDFCKIVTVDSLSLAFTRLAINDSSEEGNQPFYFGDYIGVFNAEIYNHKELAVEYRLKLEGKSDAEVILPLYEKKGEEFIALLDGFFSGVIYDKRENKVIFARDYLGKKPLFLAYDLETTYIVSELKALPKIEYFKIVPKGFSKLDTLKNSLKLETLVSNKLRLKPLTPLIPKVFLKEALYEAVRKRIIGIENMKFGVFLSGGLDSSIIALIINELVPKDKVHYYYIANENHSDAPYIKIMKEFLEISNESISEVYLPTRKELKSILEEVVYATESINPSIISNGIGTYLLSKKVNADGIKVVITGDGADEFFMGYQDRDIVSKTSAWKRLQKSFIDDLHTTELRRVDLSCMVNTVEVRCPFLDKKIYDIVMGLEYADFFGEDSTALNKNILRKLFTESLPQEIISRKKVSFDVGSGIQKMLVELCRENNLTEIEYLKVIWNKFFDENLHQVSKHPYFWSYPQFNEVISKRGEKYLNE